VDGGTKSVHPEGGHYGSCLSKNIMTDRGRLRRQQNYNIKA
jgi:hypothetical protein